MSERNRMAFGANMGFARLYCGSCRSETVHRAQRCIHCGTAVGVERRESTWQYKDGLQIKRRRA